MKLEEGEGVRDRKCSWRMGKGRGTESAARGGGRGEGQGRVNLTSAISFSSEESGWPW